MGLLDKIKSQKNEVKYSIVDKKIMIGGKSGSGKEQPISEPILSESGWVTMGSIKVGDRIFGRDGKLCNVTGIFPQGIKKVYKVSFSDGTSTRCGEEHLWKVFTPTQTFKNKRRESEGFFIKPLIDIMKDYFYIDKNDGHKKHRYSIPITNPIEFDNKINLKLDPYFLGLMLGDGGLTGTITFTNPEYDILSYIYKYMEDNNKKYLTRDFENHKQVSLHDMRDLFRELNLYGCGSREKFIPKEYLYSSIENRRLLLSGIINTDGSVSKKVSISITTYSYDLYEDIKELSRGLGYIAIGRKKDRTDENSTKKYDKEIEYTIHLIGDFKDLKLSQKHLSKLKPRKTGAYSKLITNIELVGEEESKCIMVDNEDHLYITKDYIVTHNTAILHEMSNIIAEETGNNEAVLVLPLENRYAPYVDFRKYVTPELDFYNKDEKLRKNLIFQEPTHYKNFLHVCSAITEIITEKLKDPSFPVQMVAFDTFGSLVEYAKDHLKWEMFQRTKKVVTDNSYGNYGAIYKDALELIKNNIFKPLEMVNYIPLLTFHMKEKSFKDKVSEEEYVAYAPEIPSSIFDNVVKMFDYSIIFEDDSYIKNGTLQYGNERTLRWRNGNNYTGCKATATLDKIPASQDIKGLTDKQIARLVVDTIINSIAKEGYTADKIKEELKKSQLDLENSNKELIENRQQIIQEEEISMADIKARENFVSNLETLLKTVNDSSRVQLENYLKTVTGEKSISDWVSDVNKDTFNKVADTINNAISGIDGIEKLPRLE